MSNTRRHAACLAFGLCLITLAVNLQAPLYTAYAELSGYGAAATASAFSGYVLGVLPVLLVLGGLSDRIGRKPPIVVALLLSMVLRFLPRCRAQYQAVREAQMGLSGPPRGGLERARMTGKLASVTVTWALENAIETADSMKSRGYGLPGRTAFSIYRFDSRDKAALLWLGFCGFFIASGWMAGGFYWRYYPTIKGAPVTPLTVMMHLCYLALCLTPVIVDRREEQTWKRLDREESSCGT